jgi:RNA polymerase sigma factor (sigma-70 family)
MEASTIPATAGLAPRRATLTPGPLLRLRSDEQLVRLFRAGSDEAFRTIHDRYRPRLLAYARQMLSGSSADAEDALQDVFVRAYAALRANDREVSLRAWLYRVAHNRCIDDLRRPAPPPPETFDLVRPPACDPSATTERRESLRRLVEDIGRLPEQQRSALLMREMSGMSYDDLAGALDVTVPAVKSLLVRARIGLVQASDARDAACVEIRESLVDAHERGVRATGLARRHLQDCDGCRAYRGELRATRERLAALVPTLGPGALLAKLLGLGGGAGAASGIAAAGGGAGAAGGGLAISASQAIAVVAATVVSAGGAVELSRTLKADRPSRPVAVHVAPAPILTPAGRGIAALPGTAVGRLVKTEAVAAPTEAPSAPPPVVENANGGATLPAELVEPETVVEEGPPPAAEPVDEGAPPPADEPPASAGEAPPTPTPPSSDVATPAPGAAAPAP